MYFLGTIQATGTAVSNNSQPTGAFTLPVGLKAIYLQPNATGVQWEVENFGATGATFATTAARGAFLAGPNQINGPYKLINAYNTVVSIINAGSGVAQVRIYAAPTS